MSIFAFILGLVLGFSVGIVMSAISDDQTKRR